MQQRCVKKKCSPALRNVPRSCLSESNPPLLRNKEDQMASSISQGFALCNSRQNYEEPFYVLGWDKILVKLLSEYVSQATINKLNYFKFENGCDCINNLST